jgi:hypothetical protein
MRYGLILVGKGNLCSEGKQAMTSALPAAKVMRLLIVCIAAAILAVGGAAYIVNGHAVHHAAASGLPSQE